MTVVAISVMTLINEIIVKHNNFFRNLTRIIGLVLDGCSNLSIVDYCHGWRQVDATLIACCDDWGSIRTVSVSRCDRILCASCNRENALMKWTVLVLITVFSV